MYSVWVHAMVALLTTLTSDSDIPTVSLEDTGNMTTTELNSWWLHVGDIPALHADDQGLPSDADLINANVLTGMLHEIEQGSWPQIGLPTTLNNAIRRAAGPTDSHWWLMTRFRVDPSVVNRNMALWLDMSESHIHVFVNGHLLDVRGQGHESTVALRSPQPPVRMIPAALMTIGENTLEIEVYNPLFNTRATRIVLMDPRDVDAQVFLHHTLPLIVYAGVTAVLVAVVLFFLLWYSRHRDEYENLFLVLGVGGFAMAYACSWLPWFPGHGALSLQLTLVALPMSSFLTLFFQHRYRIHAHRGWIYAVISLTLLGVFIALWAADSYALVRGIYLMIPVTLVGLAYAIYVNARALRLGNREAAVVLGGYALYVLGVGVDSMMFSRYQVPGTSFLSSIGVAALAAAIVVSLTARFSRLQNASAAFVADLRSRQELQDYLVSRIVEAAGAIEVTSGHILASASQQQFGATEQSTAVDETRRTMETLLTSGRTITMAAHDVLRNAEMTQQNNQAVTQRIAESSNHSRRISEILDIIRDIANKSELLALNAALEGSRAGEAGRGFALVATQMQRLAENVMSAVADIKELTSDIRTASGATETSTRQAAQLASETTESAHKISLIIQEQQVATEQVRRAMDDVAKIASQTAQSGQTTLERTQALLEKARSLRTLVEQYRSKSLTQSSL